MLRALLSVYCATVWQLAPSVLSLTPASESSDNTEPEASSEFAADPDDDSMSSGDETSTVAASDTGRQATRSEVAHVFNPRVADRLDPYGPRPARVPSLTREQVVRYALENPLVRAAEDNLEAMRADLARARFAWVPVVKASATLSPGANIRCDDLQVVPAGPDGTADPTSTEPVTLQYCRAVSDGAAVDAQTVRGYLAQLGEAGIAVRLSADFVVPLFTFGKLRAVRDLAEVGVAIAGLAREQARQETVMQVSEAYVGLLLARESIRILNDAWTVVQDEREKIESDVGAPDDFDADPDDVDLDRDPDDMLELEVGEIELATRMQEARKLESLALASLWALAGRAAPPGFDIADERLSVDRVAGGLQPVAHYRELAVRSRPEAKMAEGLVRARKAQEKLARANFLPDLGLAVRLGYGWASAIEEEPGAPPALYYAGRWNYSMIVAALAVSWNFDFHNDTFELRKARALQRQAIHQREAAVAMLGMAVEQAYRDFVEARDRVSFMALARDKSWQLVVSQQQKSTVGGGDFGDLRRALTSWAEYEFKHFEAIQAQNVALAKLARAVGTPLASM